MISTQKLVSDTIVNEFVIKITKDFNKLMDLASTQLNKQDINNINDYWNLKRFHMAYCEPAKYADYEAIMRQKNELDIANLYINNCIKYCKKHHKKYYDTIMKYCQTNCVDIQNIGYFDSSKFLITIDLLNILEENLKNINIDLMNELMVIRILDK